MPQIQIHAVYDNKKVLTSYNVYTWNGPDQGMIVTPYSIQDAQAKFASILQPGSLGTLSAPDRVTLTYLDDGSLLFAQSEVTKMSQDSFSIAPPKVTSDLTAKQLADIAATKTDIETKTGKPIASTDITAQDIGGEIIK